VVGWSRNSSNYHHPFIWKDLNSNGASDPGEFLDLGYFGSADGHGRALGISQNGRYVAGYFHNDAGFQQGFRWYDADDNFAVDAGEVTLLPVLDPNSTNLTNPAYAVNDSGQVVGWYYNANGQKRAYQWTDSNSNHIVDSGELFRMGELGYPAIIGDVAWAKDINNAGQVVGATLSALGERRAFLFQDANHNQVEDAGETINLGTIYSVDQGTSEAYGISENGYVVGQAYDGTGYRRAFRWKDNNANGAADPGEMINLDTVSGGHSDAYTVNNDGDAVGFLQAPVRGWQHVLFRNGGVFYLSDLVPPGWRFWPDNYLHINDAGKIGATGAYGNAYSHAFVLVPGAAHASVRVADVTGAPGQTVTLTARLKNAAGTADLAGRTLSFTIDGTSAGSGVTGPDGVATVGYKVPEGPASRSISAAFSGDELYNPVTGTASSHGGVCRRHALQRRQWNRQHHGRQGERGDPGQERRRRRF